MILVDPDNPPRTTVAALKSLFLLTEAEARIAQALAEGMTIKEYADKLELSEHTVRSQVKNIFRKCAVRSQAELLQLFARSTAAALSERPNC